MQEHLAEDRCDMCLKVERMEEYLTGKYINTMAGVKSIRKYSAEIHIS